MMPGRGCIVVLLSCVFYAAVSGCSGNEIRRAPVQGDVTYKGDPAANVMVSFIDDIGVPSMGTTDIKGKFEISAVPVGNLIVSVKSLKPETGDENEADEPLQPDSNVTVDEQKRRDERTQQRKTQRAAERAAEGIKIPAIYNGLNSGLTATVSKNPADNVFHFKLE